VTDSERKLYTRLSTCKYCGRIPAIESITNSFIVCDANGEIQSGYTSGVIKHRMYCICSPCSQLPQRDTIVDAIHDWNVEQQKPKEDRWSEGAGGSTVYYDANGNSVYNAYYHKR